MKLIFLKGLAHSTIVDDEDYERFRAMSWRARLDKYTFYVEGPTGLLHRLILGAGPGQEVDHIDRNGLNNLRSNLRLTDRQGNLRNRGLQKNNRIGLKGVELQGGTYRATITVNRKRIRLFGFRCPYEAARAYDAMALEYFGEHACTNASLGLLEKYKKEK